jgi:2-keto-3-deoxy-6-phosphogluconate aldolase
MPHGFREQKFFPTRLQGGAPALKGMVRLVPEIHVYPTGGIRAEQGRQLRHLPNVVAVGGTWLNPTRDGDGAELTRSQDPEACARGRLLLRHVLSPFTSIIWPVT